MQEVEVYHEIGSEYYNESSRNLCRFEINLLFKNLVKNLSVQLWILVSFYNGPVAPYIMLREQWAFGTLDHADSNFFKHHTVAKHAALFNFKCSAITFRCYCGASSCYAFTPLRPLHSF